MIRIKRQESDQTARAIRFGNVIVEAPSLSQGEIQKGIAQGTSALKRAKGALIAHGVNVKIASGVPLFHADPVTPGLLIRTLNGKETRGRIVRGRFTPI
ncbi:MAG: hypothetical protein IPK97_03035 [Ahniella sp.]|nr:hypothetical protein [Ahniella sp.]